jgi:hypothetical protein
MATKGDGVRLVHATRGDALGAQIAETMVRKVLEVLEVGGYKPTREDLTAISGGITDLALGMGHLLIDGVDAGDPTPTDAEIDEWIERAARGGVLGMLGPPPMAH